MIEFDARNPENLFTGGGVLPFIGVVESTADPLQVGRVRVRAVGYHPERAAGGVPVEHLPWAHVLLPTTAAGVSGIGATHGLLEGSWVFGYFLDGRDAQQPMVIGCFTGAPGLNSDQRAAVKAGLSVASPAPGGLASAFQTLAASTAGGLGTPSKFGATVGKLLSLASLFSNSDAAEFIDRLTGTLSSLGKVKLGAARVMDTAAASRIAGGVVDRSASASVSGYGATVIRRAAASAEALASAGGASGFTPKSPSPLSSASFGSVGEPGAKLTAENATVETRVDYDSLAAAHQSVGVVTVHSTGTPKTAAYTLDALARDEKIPGGGYDYVIDPTGQVTRISDSKGRTVDVAGTPSGAVSVALVGGGGDGPIDSKFWPVQLATLEKLVGAFVKRFPRAVVAGAGEVGGGDAPGFDVSAWAETKWPENANASGGVKKLVGKSTDAAGAAFADPRFSGASGDYASKAVPTARSYAQRVRGFVGSVSRPHASYAARREPDYPAAARTNSLTGGYGGVGASAAGGGPGRQYVALLEEPSQHAYQIARPADSLEARSVPKTWRPPVYPHGGEYGRAHVVKSTEGGHQVLLDDTPGREKVEILHSSGSSLTIQADGSGSFYLKKNSYEVVLGEKSVGVNGNYVLSVGGDMRVSVKGDLLYDVTGKISFSGSSDYHEFVRGSKSSLVEGSRLDQTKKNSVARVGKDRDEQVGGKRSSAVRGNSDDSVDGNSASTVRGERREATGGNRTALTLGADVRSSTNSVEQSKGEMIKAAGGNSVLSAKGRATVVSAGVALVASASETRVVSGGPAYVTASGKVDVNAGGAVNVDGSTVNLNSGASSAADGATAAEVDAMPQELEPDANPASKDGNLDAEQTTRGELDAQEAQDESRNGGSGAPSSVPGGGGSGGQWTQADPGPAVTAGTLGNDSADACALARDLVAKGWSPQGASAIVGNMRNESSFNPSAYTIDVNGRPSGGLIQWNGPRLAALQSWSASNGLNWQTSEAQIGFLDYEARGTHSGYGGAGMIGASDMQSAILAAANYERFVGWNNGGFTGGAWENANGNRAANGLAVYNECFGGNVQQVGGVPAGSVQGFTGGENGETASDQQNGGVGDETVPSPGTKEPYVTGGSIDWGMKVSPNFTLGQLTPTSKFREGMNPHGSGMISHEQIIRNLSTCAVNVLEVVRAGLGRPNVNSGYRSLAYNRSIGGARNSDHTRGQAVDFTVPGYSNSYVANWVEANIPTLAGIGRYANFTHVSYYEGGNRGRKRHW